MCDVCNGAHPDEVFFQADALLARGEWLGMMIAPAASKPGWHYTVGFELLFDHPDLVVVSSASQRIGHSLLTELADRIREGERLRAGTSVPTRNGTFDIIEVHPAQRAEALTAIRDRYYEVTGGLEHRREPLQIVVPELIGPAHPDPTSRGWRLDRPRPALGAEPALPRSLRRSGAARKKRR